MAYKTHLVNGKKLDECRSTRALKYLFWQTLLQTQCQVSYRPHKVNWIPWLHSDLKEECVTGTVGETGWFMALATTTGTLSFP